MRAVRIHEDGGPDVLRLEEIPDPEPQPGEVLVALRAAGLNHLDVWIRKGLPSVPKPRILGADGAGVVASLGDGVDGFVIGDRVVLNPGIVHDGRITVIGEHTDGTYCELKALPAGQLYPLDDTLSFEQGAAFPLTFETAHRMLVTKAAVQENEWVLIWGSAEESHSPRSSCVGHSERGRSSRRRAGRSSSVRRAGSGRDRGSRQ